MYLWLPWDLNVVCLLGRRKSVGRIVCAYFCTLGCISFTGVVADAVNHVVVFIHKQNRTVLNECAIWDIGIYGFGYSQNSR